MKFPADDAALYSYCTCRIASPKYCREQSCKFVAEFIKF